LERKTVRRFAQIATDISRRFFQTPLCENLRSSADKLVAALLRRAIFGGLQNKHGGEVFPAMPLDYPVLRIIGL
jgi:hypothetical protein